ncbi:14345_t:CDS:2 [Funneliformis geosporum]|uniref:5236_t:CDS:1 n=1 Tax=Funneliformis geosporum TaxID=1117311 RepID=A0A9W4WRZ0_9GLOM|nr:14345_t:CDS:2 [Funneliformis geosporum]CAI2181799.1 5236_t:CDS:2 [Funneliformis geosporum]
MPWNHSTRTVEDGIETVLTPKIALQIVRLIISKKIVQHYRDAYVDPISWLKSDVYSIGVILWEISSGSYIEAKNTTFFW